MACYSGWKKTGKSISESLKTWSAVLDLERKTEEEKLASSDEIVSQKAYLFVVSSYFK